MAARNSYGQNRQARLLRDVENQELVIATDSNIVALRVDNVGPGDWNGFGYRNAAIFGEECAEGSGIGIWTGERTQQTVLGAIRYLISERRPAE